MRNLVFLMALTLISAVTQAAEWNSSKGSVYVLPTVTCEQADPKCINITQQYAQDCLDQQSEAVIKATAVTDKLRRATQNSIEGADTVEVNIKTNVTIQKIRQCNTPSSNPDPESYDPCADYSDVVISKCLLTADLTSTAAKVIESSRHVDGFKDTGKGLRANAPNETICKEMAQDQFSDYPEYGVVIGIDTVWHDGVCYGSALSLKLN